MTEHWTGGTKLTVVPSPNPAPEPGGRNELTAMAAVSATDMWAVGSYSDAEGQIQQGLILHWDGSSWTWKQPLTAASRRLTAVTAISASDVWAVGVDDTGQPLFLHYDGTDWTQRPRPTVNLNGGSLVMSGLTAISARDIWAVGTLSAAGEQHPLIFHWDGVLWRRMPTPESAPADTRLSAVSATSSGDIWAVGAVSAQDSSETVILHWDGDKWQLMSSPDPGAGPGPSLNELRNVIAVSPDNAWAVGAYLASGGHAYHNLLAHWDGQSWTQVNTPDTADFLNRLDSVAASPDGRLWLAGSRG